MTKSKSKGEESQEIIPPMTGLRIKMTRRQNGVEVECEIDAPRPDRISTYIEIFERVCEETDGIVGYAGRKKVDPSDEAQKRTRQRHAIRRRYEERPE